MRKAKLELREFLREKREEWDFTLCHSEQASTCFYYEYYRESILRKYLLRPCLFRSIHDGKTFSCGTHISDIPLDNINLELYPEWPEKPYLAISGELRRHRLEQALERKRIRSSPLREVENPCPNGKLLAQFEIDQFAKVSDIKKAFKEWLIDALPKAQKRVRNTKLKVETRGRGSKVFSTALTDLGVVRIRNLAAGATLNQIFSALNLSETSDKALYSDDPSTWRRATRKVKGRIEDLLIELESRYEV